MIMDMPNKPKTPHRTIRVPDDVWKPAVEKAKAEGTDLSSKIRGWLTEYTEDAS